MVAHLSSFNRDSMAKPKVFIIWPFTEHFLTPVLVCCCHMLPTCRLECSRKRTLIVLSVDVRTQLKLAQRDVSS